MCLEGKRAIYAEEDLQEVPVNAKNTGSILRKLGSRARELFRHERWEVPPEGWKQSALSLAGNEVLIKAVIQAIPTYPMNLFKFPAIVCKDLDSLSAGFWWGDTRGKKRIHWVSWDKMGLPKSVKGLGFRNFQDFNDALLVKQCWRLIHNPNSLWAHILKARYFPYSSFFDARLGSR
ncbi:uncharacterized mitochondrial protein AtMg00310-like [Malus sylvestris]|uniref:uncharacterized mitochondrial protein AtMg00310-like n=1 Tax=Malus sylvestris TaxID=3752 RepID=UPI0021AD42AF|nr:uncharacterized mitochondrial protein AtMg00310-like [Malus sylvestris]